MYVSQGETALCAHCPEMPKMAGDVAVQKALNTVWGNFILEDNFMGEWKLSSNSDASLFPPLVRAAVNDNLWLGFL